MKILEWHHWKTEYLGYDSSIIAHSQSQEAMKAGKRHKSVSSMTEYDILGPCEPGTSVIFDGVIWHESNNGKRLLFSNGILKGNLLL